MGSEAWVLTEVGSQTFKLKVRLTGFYCSSLVTVCIDTGTLGFPSKPPTVHVLVPVKREWLSYAEGLCGKCSVVHMNNWPLLWRRGRCCCPNTLSQSICWVKHLAREVQHNAEKKRRSADRFVCQRLFCKYPKDMVDHICSFI